jgi:hypothetical protein
MFRTKYEKEIIELINLSTGNEELGKAVKEWYSLNRLYLENDESEGFESFKESNYTIENRLNDLKNGLSFGMKG